MNRQEKAPPVDAGRGGIAEPIAKQARRDSIILLPQNAPDATIVVYRFSAKRHWLGGELASARLVARITAAMQRSKRKPKTPKSRKKGGRRHD